MTQSITSSATAIVFAAMIVITSWAATLSTPAAAQTEAPARVILA